jgi:hypothetical protein
MQISSYLENLLTIKNPAEESLFHIVGRMKTLLEFFKTNEKYHGFAPFLQVYLHVTESVFKQYLKDQDFYNDFPAIEKVDVHFANLYFTPLKEYLFNGTKSHPWTTYFDYCSQANGIPFTQMLLGINAHINSDLITTILETDYQQEADYYKVNNILLNVIPEMMFDLVRDYKDIYGLGGVVFPPIAKYEFKHTVVKWRYDAWNNARFLRQSASENSKNIYHIQTEKIGRELIDIFEDMRNLSLLRDHIRELNSLEVGVRVVNLSSMH